jgi:hypothetical protein
MSSVDKYISGNFLLGIIGENIAEKSRDSAYYRTSGDVVILIEDTQVHRSHLAFKGMFSMEAPKPDGAQGQGGDSDANPIHLQGDMAAEFRALMWYFYDQCVQTFTLAGRSTELLPAEPGPSRLQILGDV